MSRRTHQCTVSALIPQIQIWSSCDVTPESQFVEITTYYNQLDNQLLTP